jgi:hypothetical protein
MDGMWLHRVPWCELADVWDDHLGRGKSITYVNLFHALKSLAVLIATCLEVEIYLCCIQGNGAEGLDVSQPCLGGGF